MTSVVYWALSSLIVILIGACFCLSSLKRQDIRYGEEGTQRAYQGEVGDNRDAPLDGFVSVDVRSL